jgi:tetratricopeptide (TPR) repeat protein
MSTTGHTAAGARVGRARLTPGQLWQVPTFLAGALAFLAVALSAPVRRPPEVWQFDGAVIALRQGLQRGQDPDSLAALAETALAQVYHFGDRAAEVYFLAGSAFYRQARVRPPAQCCELWARATEHLEKAQQLGVEERDQPALEFRLGWALYQQGRDIPRALELMTRSAERGAENPLDGYQLLVQAQMKLTPPDLEAALAASRKVIEMTDDRDADGLAKARLAHAELLLRKDLRAEVVQELDRVGPKVSRPLRLQARLLQVRCCEQEGLWAKALAVWKGLLPDAAFVPGGRARVLYAIGWCNVQLDPPDEVHAAQAWEETLKLGGPEGQAAGLRLGGLRLFGSSPDAARALEAWRQALGPVGAQADYRNPYLELAEVRSLFERALTLFADLQDYDRMRAAAEQYAKLAPPGLAQEKVAQASEAQAKKLQADAKAPVEEVRTHYRQAAEAYEQAAKDRPDKEGFAALWRSARCFLEAHDTARAAVVLTQLDRLDQGDARLAEGWFLLAEAYRAAEQPDKARPAYLRSMQYAATPFAARARYQLALEAADRKDWKAAEDILQPNLAALAGDREAHEKSLYQMAWVQLQKQDFGRASFFLKQATGRYPNNPRALLVRGELAECYRRLADQAYRTEQEQRQTFGPDLSEEKQDVLRHHQETRRKWLREAAAVYQALADEVRERKRQRKLTDLEDVLARRATLGLAECHHDLGEFREALRLYLGLVRGHRAKIETLIACERLIQLQDLAQKTDLLPDDGRRELAEAVREALPQAQADLAGMNKDSHDFRGDNVWSWQRWQQWLTVEQKRLGG